MIYTIISTISAAISARDLTFISIQPNIGDGHLVRTNDEDGVDQYFFIGANGEVIQIVDISITDIYSGIPISLMRPEWANTIIEAVSS